MSSNLRIQIFAEIDTNDLDSEPKMLEMGFDGSRQIDPLTFQSEDGMPNELAVIVSSRLLAKALLRNIELADMSGLIEKKELKNLLNGLFTDSLELK